MGSKKNYEDILPEGYLTAMVIDAQNKRFIRKLNIAASILLVLIVAVAWVMIRPQLARTPLWALAVFLLSYLVYIVLHELIHGIVYKLFTGKKLKFGITLTVAYCGVPETYVYRKPALTALLSPFLLFFPVFLLPTLLLHQPELRFLAAVLFASHLSGCAGDLYCSYIYFFRFRRPDTLMLDTGPCQTFYLPKEAIQESENAKSGEDPEHTGGVKL